MRNMPKDAPILLPVSIRLPANVVQEARQQGEFVRGGASQVLRTWLVAGKAKLNHKFLRGQYDAPIQTNK
jgi:hypothetical protein